MHCFCTSLFSVAKLFSASILWYEIYMFCFQFQKFDLSYPRDVYSFKSQNSEFWSVSADLNKLQEYTCNTVFGSYSKQVKTCTLFNVLENISSILTTSTSQNLPNLFDELYRYTKNIDSALSMSTASLTTLSLTTISQSVLKHLCVFLSTIDDIQIFGPL